MDILKRFSSNLCQNYSLSYFGKKFLNNKFNHAFIKSNYGHYIKRTSTRILTGSALIGFGLLGVKNVSQVKVGAHESGLPYYTREEVAKHRSNSEISAVKRGQKLETSEAPGNACCRQDRVWIIYKEGVYDITGYIEEHPGGEDTIIQSAGVSVEPFWAIYVGHEDNEEVTEILESFRIGNLKLKPGEPPGETPEFKKARCDYFTDPDDRSHTLKTLSTQPYIGSPVSTSLMENFLTPTDSCFVHNHMPVPNTDLSTYKLKVEIKGKCSKSFTLDELKSLEPTFVTATLQCASNRSAEMASEFNRFVQGTPWEHTAIYNAEWKGVLLLDVLKEAGYDLGCECNPHVQFDSLECPQGNHFSTSIPLWRAVKDKCEVLLAYEMNGEPLSRDHGYPLRVVIPGVAGTRWVKSLEKVTLQENECKSKWYQTHYKMLDSSIIGPDLKEKWLKAGHPAQELPVNAAICKPLHRQFVKVKGGRVQVEGYAWSGGGQKIARVEISTDHGRNWLPAKITSDDTTAPPYHWTWALWRASIPIRKGQKCIDVWVKATDCACNTQPENIQWNFGGIACNAIHKIRMYLE